MFESLHTLPSLTKTFDPPASTSWALTPTKFLSIPTTDKKRTAYLAKTGTTYPTLHLTHESLEAFGNVNVYPTLFISGPDLRIRGHLINYQDLETLEAAIREVIDPEREY